MSGASQCPECGDIFFGDQVCRCTLGIVPDGRKGVSITLAREDANMELIGRPVEVFMVLVARDEENPVLSVDAVFSGLNRLGLAQRHQLLHGGYIVKALYWDEDA